MKKIILFSGFLLGLCTIVSAETVVVQMNGTAAESQIMGTVKLTETEAGLKLEAHLTAVPNPGDHGFHIHENGSCADVGKAAGGHFNPDNVMHGLLAKNGHDGAHAGDMGNVIVDENGEIKFETVLPQVGLITGKYRVAGRSIILHEKKDDFSQPTGNAGGRIACGIIEVKE